MSSEIAQQKNGKLVTLLFVGQFILIGMCYLFYALNRISFPVGLNAIGKTFHFSVVQTTTLGTFFLLGQAIIDIPIGYICDRVDRRWLFFLGMLVSGLATLCFTVMTFNFVSALFWRVVFGVSEGMLNITIMALMGVLIPGKRGFLTNLMSLFYTVGAFFGPICLALLIDKMGQWQGPLQIYSGATILCGIVVLFTLRMSEKEFSSLADHKRKILVGESLWKALSRLIKKSEFWSSVSVAIFNLITFWSFGGLSVYMMVNYKHMSTVEASMILGTAYGLGSFFCPLFGYLADRYGDWKIVVTLGLVDVICLYVLFCTSITTFWILLVAALLFGAGCNTIYFMGYVVVQNRVGAEQVGLATGFTGALGYLLAAFTGLGIGLITKSIGYLSAVYILLIAPEILAVIAALFFLRKIRYWVAAKADTTVAGD
jgi:ACS family hexuronate transporter-like MFS transporter